MELDPRTLIAASMLVSAVLGLASVVFSMLRGGTRLIGAWGWAMLLLSAGLLLIALRGTLPDAMSIVLGNTAIVAALVLGIRSLRIFVGVPTQDALGWSLTAALALLMLFFSEVRPNHDARVFASSTAIAVICMRMALLLRRHAPPSCRLSANFAQGVFWLAGAGAVGRIAGTLMHPSVDFLAPLPLNAAVFLSNAGFIVAGTLAATAMEIEALQGELLRLARTDALTGLGNRGAFGEEFRRELSRCARNGPAFSLALFDLDRFKLLNDRLGHPAGDLALKAFAEVLRSSTRQHDSLARYGGEEFALLMPQTDKETAARVAERVRQQVEERGLPAGAELARVTVSGGVATYGIDGTDWDALISAADAALYEAKNTGRNRVVTARPGLRGGAQANGIKSAA